MNGKNHSNKPDARLMVVKGLKNLAMIALFPAVFYLFVYIFAKTPDFNLRLALFIAGGVCAVVVFISLAYFVNQGGTNVGAMLSLGLGIGVNIGLNLLMRGETGAEPVLAPMHIHVLVNLALLGIAYGGGVLLSKAVKKASYLIPLAAAAAIADLWSVGWGATREIVQSPAAMNYLLFAFPVAGKGILPLIGVTDFVFAALFLALSHRFDLSIPKTQILLIAAFWASIAFAVVFGVGVPVLPLMGLFFIGGHFQRLKITDPREKKEALAGLLIIIAALTIISLVR